MPKERLSEVIAVLFKPGFERQLYQLFDASTYVLRYLTERDESGKPSEKTAADFRKSVAVSAILAVAEVGTEAQFIKMLLLIALLVSLPAVGYYFSQINEDAQKRVSQYQQAHQEALTTSHQQFLEALKETGFGVFLSEMTIKELASEIISAMSLQTEEIELQELRKKLHAD